ncbi:beta-1,3-galactosyltransferase 5-like [Ascaphus truei]|uniref:beta-1,3-galactosyltransferase 5-like n=1 Tax=Ascaphus truei TaxID=8439 RepID=UPI003F599594
MAPIRIGCLKLLLCFSAFLSLLLLWCQLSQESGVSGEGWSWAFPFSAFWGNGVDFSSLFSGDLPEPLCQRGQVLMILVTSHPAHLEHREAIRKTWAAPGGAADYTWKVFFLIGHTVDRDLEWHLQKEQGAYGDILMGSYVDTYRNLTLKVMHGIKWAVDRCRPQYILKTDDDCFVNTDRLPTFLAQHNPVKTGLYVGSAFSRDKRVVIRDSSSKWYVSHGEYGLESYPPYASGIGYILSLDAARAVLRMAELVSPIPVEDAYVGLLAEKAGVRLLSSARFAKHNIKWSICNYRYLMVIHRLSPQDQEIAQDSVRRARTTCLGNKEVTHWK